ncbi:MAG TPA: D-TA family PLP-dependent enzyme, partial [Devosia sp.]|nr:D-TA family PLP-dependent enzyme [Devosia sp.]
MAESDWQAQLDTPVPVVDMATVRANIRALQDDCDRAGVANRPHIKTHKSIMLARLQIEHGARGITCQKLAEAELMARAGFDDVLISYNIIGRPKMPRLAALHEKVDLRVVSDNETVVDGLSAAVATASRPLKVLVECDTGRQRCGVPSPAAAAKLAERINNAPGLTFDGLMLYPPSGPTGDSARFVTKTRELCAQKGLEVTTLSAGGTPNRPHIGGCGETEYRAGTCIYNDRQMMRDGVADLSDCALFVYTSVIGHPQPGRIMLDAGSKALSSDLLSFDDFGFLPDYPEARIYEFNEEHGFVDVSRCTSVPAIGEVVRVLPNHVCPVSNLFDQVLLREADGTLRP